MLIIVEHLIYACMVLGSLLWLFRTLYNAPHRQLKRELELQRLQIRKRELEWREHQVVDRMLQEKN